MPEESLLVRKIRRGTVIDHILPGKGIQVMEALGLTHSNERKILGMNLASNKMGRKDLLKIEDWIIDQQKLNVVGLISPGATANVIEGSTVIEKIKVEFPGKLTGLKCSNENCITNSGEPVITEFVPVKDDTTRAICKYCGWVWKGKL